MQEHTKLEAVRAHAAYYRRDHEMALKLIDASESIVMRLPESVLNCVGWGSGEWMQISTPNREQAEAVLSALDAGRWEKKISAYGPTRIDYEGVVDGVRIIIYGAEPPTSCRIAEREEDVPAHKKIVRELVCS